MASNGSGQLVGLEVAALLEEVIKSLDLGVAGHETCVVSLRIPLVRGRILRGVIEAAVERRLTVVARCESELQLGR